MVRCFSLILVFCIHFTLAIADTDGDANKSAVHTELVLVTFDPDCTSELSSIELRKLFLGLRTRKNQHIIKPLRNKISQEINDLFIQAVMAMSSRTYERRLIMGIFQQGRPRPPEYDNIRDLLEVLQQQPCSLTYIWSNQASQIPKLKIIQILWSGSLAQ